MPRTMPVAIRDETGAFIRQMAQGNEALAQLYTKLLAQYEERRMNEAHQKEMMGMRENIAQDRIGAANDEWYRRREFDHSLRNPNGAPTGPNYLGPGASGVPNPMAPAAQPTAAPTSAAPSARPSVYTIDNNPFSKGAGANTPATPAPRADAGAQDTEFSAQSRKPLPTVDQPPRSPRRETPDNTQLPNQPRVTPRQAATRPQGQFLEVDAKWLDLMHTMEDKYNLPRGVMMTTYGIENGGGRQFGRNSKSSAEGIYQFTKELRDEHRLSDRDIYDPAKMIPAAAMNMRRNADILEQKYGIKLPATPETIPMFHALHQWGSGRGPRVVKAYLQNPDARMIDHNIMGTQKDAQGNVIPNYTILANQGHNPTITVKEALRNKAVPWYSAYTQQFSEHAMQPQGKYTPVAAPQIQPGAGATPTTSAGDPNAPRPPSNIPPQQHGTMGTSPRLVRAVRGGAELALPPGYTLEQTSGARPGGRSASHHHKGNAGDFRIVTPTGERIPHSGPDYTGLYTRLARGVKTWVRENDPEAEKHIGYGGAFETSKGSGRADTMHYDWGGSRGRLHPEVQFSRLQPLADHERNAPTQTAQRAQPGPASPPTQTAQATPTSSERAIMPAISRIPTSDEVAATYDNKIASAGFDGKRAVTPKVATAPVVPEATPQGIKPSASGVTARSDLDYGLDEEGRFQRGIRDSDWYKEFVTKYNEHPDLDDPNYNYRAAWKAGAQNNLVRDPTDNNMLHWPSQFKGPDHPNRFVDGVDTITGQPSQGRITPPDVGTLAARSDLAYNATPASTPADNQLPGDQYGSYFDMPMPPIRPPIEQEITQADRSPTSADSVQDAMVDAMRQRTEPNYTNEAFNVQKPPADMPPQLEAGAIPRTPLPDEFTSVSPAQATPDPMLGGAAPPNYKTLTPNLDVANVTPRVPLPPGFKVPLPQLDGSSVSATASAPTNTMPRGGTQLPPNLPRQLEPEVVSGNAPTMRSVIDAIYNGQLPNMSTEDPRNARPPSAPSEPRNDNSYKEYINSGDSKATLNQIGEWLKEKYNYAGEHNKPPVDNQEVFQRAVQEFVKNAGPNAASMLTNWLYRDRQQQPPKMDGRPPGAPVAAPPPAPIRTMPDGRPYIPEAEPLNVPPRAGSGPANTTLSQPATGADAVPLPGAGAGKPAAKGTPVQRIVGPDGVPVFVVPNAAIQAPIVEEAAEPE